jgi:hypothetical protein
MDVARKEGILMIQTSNRRFAAVKAADAINAIEGAPVTEYAKTLSVCWAKGEITGQQMKAALLASHKRIAAAVQNRG